MSTDSHIGRHYFVGGRVQGVFFRAETQSEADRLGLTGWVRNLPDGRVEIRAYGPSDKLDALQEWLRRGPSMAQVSKLECEPVAYAEQPGFRVLPTPPPGAGQP